MPCLTRECNKNNGGLVKKIQRNPALHYFLFFSVRQNTGVKKLTLMQKWIYHQMLAHAMQNYHLIFLFAKSL